MRILHVAKFFPPCPGGIERFVADLSLAQAVAGHQVTVVCFAHQNLSDATFTEQPHPRLTVIRVRTLLTLAFAPIAPDFFRALQQSCKTFDPDWLHIHLPNIALLPCLMTRYARNKPWLLHWHSDVPNNARSSVVRLGALGYRWMESQALKRARLIIATSNAYAASSVYLQAHAERVRVVPLGLGDGIKVTPVREARRALFIGRFAYYKGLNVLLDALALASDWRLILVGDGPERSALETQTVRLGLSARVSFLGVVDEAEKAFELARASVLCLPSIERTEAFGLVLLEAYRAGCPVLAAKVPGAGMIDVVDEGRSGWLVEADSAAALADGLARAADSDCNAMGAAARELFVQRYQIEHIAAQIERLTDEMLRADAANGAA